MSYVTAPARYNTYLKDLFSNLPRNTGMLDVLIAILVSEMNDSFQEYALKFGNSSGTKVNVYFRFPEKNIEVNLPGIFITSKDSRNYSDSMGYIHGYNKNNGEIIYGMRGIPIVEFDIWARNDREKNVIEGILINYLHSRIADGSFLFSGIQNINFMRSVPRGYDQTDRVLQFHTHQVGSDDIFRQVAEFEIEFDHQLVFTSAVQNIGVIKEIIWSSVDVSETIYGNFESQQFKINIS